MKGKEKPTKVKHKIRLLTPTPYSSIAIGSYGFYEVGKTIILTHIFLYSQS